MSERPLQGFFGALLFGVGALMTLTCGMCSLGAVVIGVPAILQGRDVLSNLGMGTLVLAVFGGVPIGMGVALIVAGRALMNAGRDPSRGPPFDMSGQPPP